MMSDTFSTDARIMSGDRSRVSVSAVGMAPDLELPLLPVLEKVPTPAAIKRQAPGFDMRTLRKQLDVVYAEVEERHRQQSLLYDQNHTLFQYLQKLLHTNQVSPWI